jgi:type III secretory pathway component EscR
VFFKLHQRVINYGTNKNINNSTSDIEKKILEGKSIFILLPDDNIKKFWNILMIFLLFYVATWVPYNICFNASESEGMEWVEPVDLCVDFLFLIDILINFLSSYEDV